MGVVLGSFGLNEAGEEEDCGGGLHHIVDYKDDDLEKIIWQFSGYRRKE